MVARSCIGSRITGDADGSSRSDEILSGCCGYAHSHAEPGVGQPTCTLSSAKEMWLITAAERSSTTVLLPKEYSSA
jgi:hypothetical protein